MPIKTLVVIALRLYAIYWFVESLADLIAVVPMVMSLSSHVGINLFTYFLIPGCMLVMSAALWICASKLSSAISRGYDIPLSFNALSREDLYAFAFVFLGIYFALSSLLIILQTAYQFFEYDFSFIVGSPIKGHYFWPLLGHILTLIAGLVCILRAGSLSRYLGRAS